MPYRFGFALLYFLAAVCILNTPGAQAESDQDTIRLKSDSLAIIKPFQIDTTQPDAVSNLLQWARTTHEPTRYIKQCVRLLDRQITASHDKRILWMQLAEALQIGFAGSIHATSPSEAWQRAYALDSTDCHSGSLLARTSEEAIAKKIVQGLLQKDSLCPEALYLKGVCFTPYAGERLEILKKSYKQRPSAECRLALGRACLDEGLWPQASTYLDSVVDIPVLFPEDWRPEVWAEVHAALGLAWAELQQNRLDKAEAAYRKFREILFEPGPWHDLDSTEEAWFEKLATRWPGITGYPWD